MQDAHQAVAIYFSKAHHTIGMEGEARGEQRHRESTGKACTSISNTKNQVPRLPSSKVYHAPESASKNKRLFSVFSSKPTKKRVSAHLLMQGNKEINQLRQC